MNQQLPALYVTPEMAVRFARSVQQRITKKQGKQWLVRNRIKLEAFFQNFGEELVEEALQYLTLEEWPDPQFDAMYRKIENAIDNAIMNYADINHLEISEQSYDVEGMTKLANYFLRRGRKRAASGFVSVEFSCVDPGGVAKIREAGWDRALFPEMQPYIFHVRLERGRVTAAMKSADAKSKLKSLSSNFSRRSA